MVYNNYTPRREGTKLGGVLSYHFRIVKEVITMNKIDRKIRLVTAITFTTLVISGVAGANENPIEYVDRGLNFATLDRVQELENLDVNLSGYTPEQLQILSEMNDREIEYKKYGDSAPISQDKGNNIQFYSTIGKWIWRDGIICVTDQGFGTQSINTWHAGIIAPQVGYSIAEAPGKLHRVRLSSGQWYNGTVWQVTVKSTSIQQDYDAGEWAGWQVGKPYNLNFWNARQTDSFYCSQLVWAAFYYTSGVDLNKPDNDIGSAIAIHPGEFVNNSKTNIVYRNR